MNVISQTTGQNNNPTNSVLSKKEQQGDRYISFCGLDCDVKADKLIAMLENNINAESGDKRWHTYFIQKRGIQKKLQHDNLNFIGHQTNTLYEYFDQCEDQEAKELLYQIEQNCC